MSGPPERQFSLNAVNVQEIKKLLEEETSKNRTKRSDGPYSISFEEDEPKEPEPPNNPEPPSMKRSKSTKTSRNPTPQKNKRTCCCCTWNT
jgi:hypothetical protein